MQGTWARPKVVVSADGTGVVAHAGTRLLVDLADTTGLTNAFSDVLAGLRRRDAGHDPGRVAVDLAVMLADGGQTISDLAVLRQQPAVFGSVASTPTAWRVLAAVEEPERTALARALAAHAVAAHQPGDALTAVPHSGLGEFGMDTRRPVGAVRRRMHRADLGGQLLVDACPGALLAAGVLVVGGPGDLQQLARALDVVLAGLLRLDERIHVHRVSLAKKAWPASGCRRPLAACGSPAAAGPAPPDHHWSARPTGSR
jgi:hypothetical protein